MPNTVHVRVPASVHDAAEEIREEYDYPTLGEALRHMIREGGYDV
jgi:hypothetical protein